MLFVLRLHNMGKTSGSSHHQVHVQEQCDTWLSATTAAKLVPSKKKGIQKKTPNRRSAPRTAVNPALLDISWSSQPMEIKATKQASITNFLKKNQIASTATSCIKDAIKTVEPSLELLVTPKTSQIEADDPSLQSEALHQFDDYYISPTMQTQNLTLFQPMHLSDDSEADTNTCEHSNSVYSPRKYLKKSVRQNKMLSKATHEDNFSSDSCSSASVKTVTSSVDLFPDISDASSTESCDRTLSEQSVFKVNSLQLGIDEKDRDKGYAYKCDEHTIRHGNVRKDRTLFSESLQLSLQSQKVHGDRESSVGEFSSTLTFSEPSQKIVPPTFPGHHRKKHLSILKTRKSHSEESAYSSLPTSQASPDARQKTWDKPADTLLLFSQEKENIIRSSNNNLCSPSRNNSDEESIYSTARSQVMTQSPKWRSKTNLFASVNSLENYSTSETYDQTEEGKAETLTLGLSQDTFLRDMTNQDMHASTESETSDMDLFDSLTFHSSTPKRNVSLY